MKYFYPPQETDMKTRITATAALIFGFVLGAFSAAQATKPETQPKPQPVIKTYDCDTLGDIPSDLYFEPSAAHPIQRAATQRHHVATTMGKRPNDRRSFRTGIKK